MHVQARIPARPDVRGDVDPPLLRAIGASLDRAQACTSCAEAPLSPTMRVPDRRGERGVLLDVASSDVS